MFRVPSLLTGGCRLPSASAHRLIDMSSLVLNLDALGHLSMCIPLFFFPHTLTEAKFGAAAAEELSQPLGRYLNFELATFFLAIATIARYASVMAPESSIKIVRCLFIYHSIRLWNVSDAYFLRPFNKSIVLLGSVLFHAILTAIYFVIMTSYKKPKSKSPSSPKAKTFAKKAE